MKKLLLFLFFASACAVKGADAPPPLDTSQFFNELKEFAAWSPTEIPKGAERFVIEPHLFDVHLAAGDHGSINISDSYNNGIESRSPTEWLSQGYDGIRFIGEGVGVTNIRCTSWDGVTLFVTRHAGIVRFENLTVYAGQQSASQFGEQNLARVLTPGFEIQLVNVEGIAPAPELGKSRTKWIWFGYNANLYARNVVTHGKQAREHDFYWHGTAGAGMDIKDCDLPSSGAEGIKNRSDATETAWGGSKQVIWIRDCTFRDWHQTWSDRGGAAIVMQGTGAHIVIERNYFWGDEPDVNLPANERSKCIMVSSEAQSYDQQTGRVGVGYGNGYVLIRKNAIYGRSLVPWGNTTVLCEQNSGSQQSARGFLMEGSGAWGEGTVVHIGDMRRGSMVIHNCNTPDLRVFAREHGMNADFETQFPGRDRLIPLSEGIIQ